MVDGVNVVCLVETVLDEKETAHSFESSAGSSDFNDDKETGQTLGCTACDIYFTNKADYDRHKEKNCRNRYPCTLCTTSFRRHDHLKRHLNSVHSNLRLYTCPVCKEDCKRHYTLLKHIQSSHSDKPCIFHCRDCTYECGSLNDFENHQRMHILNERHLCPHCNTSFKRRDHMLRHVKSKHLLQYSICPICEQTFKRRDHVSRHIREKHNKS